LALGFSRRLLLGDFFDAVSLTSVFEFWTVVALFMRVPRALDGRNILLLERVIPTYMSDKVPVDEFIGYCVRCDDFRSFRAAHVELAKKYTSSKFSFCLMINIGCVATASIIFDRALDIGVLFDNPVDFGLRYQGSSPLLRLIEQRMV
jgi:hypothetical protein